MQTSYLQSEDSTSPVQQTTVIHTQLRARMLVCFKAGSFDVIPRLEEEYAYAIKRIRASQIKLKTSSLTVSR
jgi:hypothetical protein